MFKNLFDLPFLRYFVLSLHGEQIVYNPLFELIHETDMQTSNAVTVQNQFSQQTRQQRKGHII